MGRDLAKILPVRVGENFVALYTELYPSGDICLLSSLFFLPSGWVSGSQGGHLANEFLFHCLSFRTLSLEFFPFLLRFS